MSIQVVILAAGQGKRMYSSLPKVLHPLGGKPLIKHIIDTALSISPDVKPIVVVGHQAELIRNMIKDDVHWVQQPKQLGTANAVQHTLPFLADNHHVLILYGDVPLISVATLQKFITHTQAHCIGMLTATIPHPKGYGRILRNDDQQVMKIIEEKDATETQRNINEINSGIYYVPAYFLKKWLPNLKNDNQQKEFYLTDIISLAVSEKIAIQTFSPSHIEEILGVNDKLQLSYLERYYQKQWAEKLMQGGVTLLDPARLDVRGDLKVGKDVVIDVNVILSGQVTIGDRCVIGPHTILHDVTLDDDVQIKAHSSIEEAVIGQSCVIGPFARIRPGTRLETAVHIGNFVEIKKSTIADGSKINHLSYVGDSEVGKEVNIGAGVITCNYDGIKKHKTVIGDGAFIGSNSQLVAPVVIGEKALIGAGSTITKDAPAHYLSLSRAPQISLPKKPKKG